MTTHELNGFIRLRVKARKHGMDLVMFGMVAPKLLMAKKRLNGITGHRKRMKAVRRLLERFEDYMAGTMFTGSCWCCDGPRLIDLGQWIRGGPAPKLPFA